MIAGGGNIGLRLARAIENDYAVKVIEYDKRRCEVLSGRLDRALVLQGDVTDEGLLETENVSDMDLFVAVTNDDENNIMSCLLAKRMGARRVVALINRRSYVDLLQAGQIDIAISPAQATIGTLLAHVRRGHVTRVHSLRRGVAEALEAVVHGEEDRGNRPAEGRRNRRNRARRQGDHGPSRHRGPRRGPLDRLRHRQEAPAQGGEAFRGQRWLRLKRVPRAHGKAVCRAQRAERLDRGLRPRHAGASVRIARVRRCGAACV